MLSFRTPRRGASMLLVTILLVVLIGLAGAQLATSLARSRQVEYSLAEVRTLQIAEAGLARTIRQVNQSGQVSGPVDSGDVSFAGGTYRVTGTLTDPAGTLVSEGTYNGVRVTITTGVGRPVETVHESFLKAIYAGNWTEVLANGQQVKMGAAYTYDLKFAGGVDAFDTAAYDGDYIYGDVYSGGQIHRDHQAILAKGEIVSMGNMELGMPQFSEITKDQRVIPPPDIPAMQYEKNHDVNVAAAFGSKTGTLPASSPAHIFAKGASPSGAVVPASAQNGKTNYWLEDPYEPVTTYNRKISLAPDGNSKVYFIDGNLFLHNTKTLSFTFSNPGTKVTFVVKGNIFFSDDLKYTDPAMDMVAFIAMEDPAVPNSGNVFIGDNQFGTVDDLHAILFAENNFQDNNVTATGSAHFNILGGMLAAEKVLIQRDYYVQKSHWENVPGQGMVYVKVGWYHSEMDVRFDERLKDPAFEKPPGLPTNLGPQTQGGNWSVKSWSRSG